jgi:hypothetical protein
MAFSAAEHLVTRWNFPEVSIPNKKDIEVLTICQLLRPAKEKWIASRYPLYRAEKNTLPDEVAKNARLL